jgi:threonine aldolase
MKVDLRSDTVTKPTPAMLEAMMRANVGDDVFGEDPTINELEERIAKLFGHQAALFCPSGTMSNQIAVKAHTQPMDEIILDKTSHIYYYETAGFAFHSGVSVKLVDGDRGRMTAAQVEACIQPDFDWLPKTSLVCLENTTNKGGGACYELEAIRSIRKLTRERNLSLHMDGARVFNAIIANGYAAQEIGAEVDSISVCFSKGLGAPVGSALIGSASFIKKARRIRKAMGGGMRQAGYMAAACLYALDNHMERLQIDHYHTQQLANVLSERDWVKAVIPPQTNILIFSLDIERVQVNEIIRQLAEKDILAAQFGPSEIRMVLHLDITAEMVDHTIRVLEEMKC